MYCNEKISREGNRMNELGLEERVNVIPKRFNVH